MFWKRVLGAAIVVALLVGAASLQAISYVAFEQISVTNTAVGMTAAKITAPGQYQAVLALCRNELAQIRWTMDGTTPTAAVGTLLEIGDVLTISGHDLMVNFRAIRTGAVSAQLDCHYTSP